MVVNSFFRKDIGYILSCSLSYVPVTLFCPHSPPWAAPWSKKNVCDKKGCAVENEVKEGGAFEHEGTKVINQDGAR